MDTGKCCASSPTISTPGQEDCRQDKQRWQIELFFRWGQANPENQALHRHLRNAVKLQIGRGIDRLYPLALAQAASKRRA